MFGRCSVRTSGWPFDEGASRIVIRTRGGKRGVDFFADGEFSPRLDVIETASGLTLSADLPGVAREEVNIHIEDGVLQIAGERKLGNGEVKEDDYQVQERPFGKFERRLTLPRGIETDSIEATLLNGVLTVTLKKKPEPEPRRIQVN